MINALEEERARNQEQRSKIQEHKKTLKEEWKRIKEERKTIMEAVKKLGEAEKRFATKLNEIEDITQVPLSNAFQLLPSFRGSQNLLIDNPCLNQDRLALAWSRFTNFLISLKALSDEHFSFYPGCLIELRGIKTRKSSMLGSGSTIG